MQYEILWSWPTFVFYFAVMVVASSLAGLSYLNDDKNYSTRKTNFVFVVLSFFILWIVAAFRFNVGADYGSYINIFYLIPQEGFFESFINIVVNTGIEPGFVLLNYISSYLSKYPPIIFVTSSFLMLLILYKGLGYYSKRGLTSIGLALLIFISVFYFKMFTPIRLAIAVSIVFCSYKYIVSKNLKSFTIFILLAMCFHYTAFVVWPFYFYIVYGDKNKLIKKIYIISIIIFAIGGSTLISTFLSGSKYAAYEISTLQVAFSIAMKKLIIHLPLLVSVLLFRRKLIDFNKENRIYIDLIIIRTFLILLEGVIPTFDRASNYFNIVQLILIPSFMRVVTIKKKTLVLLLILLYCILNFMLTMFLSYKLDFLMPYKFLFPENWKNYF